MIREVQTPRKAAGPGLPASTALGGLMGLLLGLGIAFVRYQTDGTARTPDDLRDHGFAVIGTVPDITDALRGGRQDIEGAEVHPASSRSRARSRPRPRPSATSTPGCTPARRRPRWCWSAPPTPTWARA